MEFKSYTKYLRFAWDEECQRVEEWISARTSATADWGPDGDKYWIGLPVEEIGCPSMQELEPLLQGRDEAADFAIMDSDDEAAKEALYDTLRGLLFGVEV